MNLFQYYLLISLSLLASSKAVPKYSKEGCNDTCGNVRIPYPFGIGVECSINKWYAVDCNSSTPYLPAFKHLQVLNVNLDDQIVTVNMPVLDSSHDQTMSIDLDRSPFLLSESHNKFVLEGGCGNAVLMNGKSVVTGCSTSCLNNSDVSEKNRCFGFSCCETTIPRNLKSYSIRLERKGEYYGYAFVVNKKSYQGGSFRDPFVDMDYDSFIPVSLLWTLVDENPFTCCYDYAKPINVNVDTGKGTLMTAWKCSKNGPYPGNAYLKDGCEATEECERCKRDRGLCTYDLIVDPDSNVATYWTFACYQYHRSYNLKASLSLDIIFVVAGIILLVGLIAIFYATYKLIKKLVIKMRRKNIFKRINGELLLKHQEEIDSCLVNKTILFSKRELRKATDNYNEKRIIGKGGQGVVYKGMLNDGRTVAIKKSKLVDERQLEDFINEVVILSQVNHRNVVKLLGCCLETEVPLLVSEFISNGTLYDLIHNESHEFPFALRIQIATEVGQALSYLHSEISIPIYHRDVKTSNVLVDDNYRAILSDFGTSMSVPMDQTHLSTEVKGTFGYLDPEYYQLGRFTEKSDVYSFGVIIVELLTREKPVSLTSSGDHRSLVAYFMLAMEEGRVISILDATVVKEGTLDQLLALADLAKKCLNQIGKNRPMMKEVATKLEIIRTSHISPTMKELSMLTDGASTSNANDNITQ